MSAITLIQAQEQLSAWLAASAAVARKQEYSIDTGNGKRTLKLADAAEIRKQIEFWEQRVRALSGSSGQRRVQYIVPE